MEHKKECSLTPLTQLRWSGSLTLTLTLFYTPLPVESCNLMKDFERLIIRGTKLAPPIFELDTKAK